MDKSKLNNLEIADLCREISILMHAGIGLCDGLALMAEEEKNTTVKKLLQEMELQARQGSPLHEILAQQGSFPSYLVGLVGVGERVGRLEEALGALACYYQQREQMNRQVRSALTYPAVLLVLMMAVILILLTKVLPVFDEVYASLGGQLTGAAGVLLMLGKVLDDSLPLLCGVLAAIALGVAVFAVHDGVRGNVIALWQRRWGDRGVTRKMNNARFAQAMAMGMSSGMLPEEAVELSGTLLMDAPSARKRCQTCRELLEQGEGLAKALGKTGMLPASSCRMLALGMGSGSGEQVMEEIAGRLWDEAKQALEDTVSKVEPAMVLSTSVLVGVILLSVMLPLMNIMTAIG